MCQSAFAITAQLIGTLAYSPIGTLLKLAREMEFDVLKIYLCHLQYIIGVGKEHIAPFTVFCHVLIFALLESFQFFGGLILIGRGLNLEKKG